jgi:type II secretory pathway component GspD/PulD (secretin)
MKEAMVARAKKRKWVNLVAGLLVGTAAQPLALFAGPNTGLDSLTLHAQREERVVAQLAGGGASRAHLALNGAIDAQRQGDLDTAAALFREAQTRQNDLTPDERRELDRLLVANALAMQSRLKAQEQVSLAEAALQQGRAAEAAALIKTITANEVYLSPADKQRFQALCQRLHMPSVGAVAPADGNPAALAHTKLQQARAELARANLDAAEALAREADQLHVNFGPREDSPRRLLDELDKARKDPKTMLTASRMALQRGELDRAEQYARAAEQAASSWTFAFSTDSPSKALKEIQTARAKAGPKSEAAGPPSSAAAEQARGLVRQGKQALAAGDVVQARKCAEQAAALKADLHWSEENPASLLAEVSRAESGSKAAAESPGAVRNKDEAQALLQKGREQLAKGDVDEANKTAARLRAAKHIHWGLFFEDTPDKFQADVEHVRAQRNKEKASELMAEARRRFEKKDYDSAEKMAYEAQKLHGSYSIWDLGDRPSKLLADVQTLRQKEHRLKLPEPPTVAKESADLSHGPLAQSGPQAVAQGMPPGMNGSTRPPVVPTGPQTRPDQFNNVSAPGVAQTPRPSMNIVPPGPMLADNAARPTPAPTRGGEAVASPMRARQLLAEARTLLQQNRLIEARDKIAEAQRLGVSFRPDEDNPNEMYQQVAFLARQRIDSLVHHAGETLRYGTQAPAVRCQDAEKDLVQARQLAAAFGQDMQPIERTLLMVNQMRRTGDLTLVSTPPASGGMLPPVGIEKGGLPNPASAPAGSSTARGLQLLEQARLELNKGETATARRFAEEAVSYGVRDEALSVLRSIDTEEMNQRALRANRAFNAILAAYNRRDYHQAGLLLSAIDTKLLDERHQARLREMINTPEMQPALHGTQVALTGHEPQATDKTSGPHMNPEFNPQPVLRTPGAGEAGRARATDDQSLLGRTKAMQEVKFQQLRQRGMDVQTQALERFRSGQTDAALDMLQDYLTELSQEQLEPGQLTLLRRPIDSRVQQFKLMKAQVDFANQSTASVREGKARLLKAQNAEQVKQKNVAELMKQYNELFKLGKYPEAEALAMRVKELDPDNPMATAAVTIARVQRRKDEYRSIKDGKEKLFNDGLNQAEDENGSDEALRNGGIAFEQDPERRKLIHKRGELDMLPMPRKSADEKLIERKLSSPVSLNFVNQPLRTVIDDLRGVQGVNIYVDQPALDEKGISQDMPVTIKLEQIALKSALNLLLHSVHLTYVVKEDVLQITTEDHARGKLEQRVISVPDLVIAVENFGQVGVTPSSNLGIENVNSPVTGTPSPITGPNTLNGGQSVGSPAGGSMANGGGNFASEMTSGPQVIKHASKTNEEMLIKLITNTIAPKSWGEQGGPGTIEYFPLTMSLVINQTPDIQDQVADLLAALRRLQDQEVAVEVKFISIAEDFFERIGVNFNLNIVNKDSTRFQPELVTGQFANPNFINQFVPDRFLSGLTPAGTLTSDLNIPITQQTYAQAIPPFGGYPGVPGFGGLTLGLAFLSDIQVFLFMEAVQGDIRSNVMQAPKLTMFNGQTATILVQDFQFFVVGVQVIPQLGQFTYFPQTSLFPLGISLTIQAVISADRRFVRLSLTPSLSNLVNGEVNLFPVVTPIFPLFDGTATGQPVVFTQFVQQPRLTRVTVLTTVAVPDGGTVLMGGLKRLSEGRNEYGPPVLSKVPYLNRLFRNTAYGRSAESLLIMVTPRIIIQAEEEEKQTGYVPPPAIVP